MSTLQKSFFDIKNTVITIETATIHQHDSIDVLLQKIDDLYIILLNRDELYQKILKKWKMRSSINDGKVAPGSNAVQRSFSDDRFLLSNICVLRSQVYLKVNNLNDALASLSEALLWFPKSIEASQRYITLLKTKASNEEDLDMIETILRRAIASFHQLRQIQSSVSDRSILNQELGYGKAATESLCLLLSQRGNAIEANQFMQQLGFTWRLSQQVWNIYIILYFATLYCSHAYT